MENENKSESNGEKRLEPVSKATSELNNLLQVIAGTSALVEDIWAGNDASEKYLAMLRTSIERAERVTSELAKHAGGAEAKTFVHPELAPFIKTRPAAATAEHRQTILVVDDEEMTLGLVKRHLCDARFHVITAQSGFEGLDVFRRGPHNFDLALVDLTMPFMDGEETFHRLREIRSDLPVVLCTGFVDHDRLQKMLLAGLSGFLRKPIPPDELIAYIRSVLDGVRFMSASSGAAV